MIDAKNMQAGPDSVKYFLRSDARSLFLFAVLTVGVHSSSERSSFFKNMVALKRRNAIPEAEP